MKPILKGKISYACYDIAVVIGSWWLSDSVSSYFFIGYSPFTPILKQGTFIMPAIYVSIFFLMGVYKKLWLYPTMGDLIRLVSATIASNFLIYVYFRIIGGFWQQPAIGLMSFYFTLTLSSAIRLAPRLQESILLYSTRRNINPKAKRALMVGAGETASTLILEIMRQKGGAQYNIMAIVDDNAEKHNFVLHGSKVMGGIEKIPEIVNKFSIEEIIIAIPTATNEQMKRITSFCPSKKCEIKVMPSIYSMSQSLASNLRNLNIEDLLGRDQNVLDISSMKKLVEGEVILVTGCGSIGSELCRQIMRFKPRILILFDMYENNAYETQQELLIKYSDYTTETIVTRIGSVQEIDRVKEVFEEFSPKIVFHSAAYKHVPLMEECPELAIKNNVFGSYNVAKSAKLAKVHKFVMISTDKAVNPTNVMGASKRLAELVVLSFNSFGDTEYACVRFGNVLGSNGSVVPIFQKQIETGGPIKVTHSDITRYFMTIPEASKLVIEAAAIAKGGELFILDMGQPVKIVDLAENMIRMAGLVPGVDIKVEFSGLRPGEKLYEELLLSGEDYKKTDNDKIYVVDPGLVSVEEATKILETLRSCIENEEDLKKCIKQLVPEYTIDTSK